MNNIFPNWNEANKILRKIVYESFGVHVIKDEEALRFTLMDVSKDNFSLIPSEHIKLFSKLIYIYTKLLFKEMNFNLSKYLYEPIKKETGYIIKNDITYAIRNYEMKKDLNVKEELLKFLGV